MGDDFVIKYYLVQMHYDNPKQMPSRSFHSFRKDRHHVSCSNSDRQDSSGIRFYIGEERRQHDLGYLTFGTDSFVLALAIPPRADRFIVDSYCPSKLTQVSEPRSLTLKTSSLLVQRIPEDGITVVASFPHTHLQGTGTVSFDESYPSLYVTGRSIWTKIIRNKTAERYLFNAEAYDFNYQFNNQLPEPVQLFPVSSSAAIRHHAYMRMISCRAMSSPLDASTAPRTRTK